MPDNITSPPKFLFGDPRLPGRFWIKASVKETGCWEWKNPDKWAGYGRFQFNGRSALAHRVVYTVLVAAIPQGLTIDHLCRNRACVNPSHLEPVTNGENVLRGIGITAQHARKTHCPQGHPYDESNTYLHRGWRHCRICFREARRRCERRKRAAAKVRKARTSEMNDDVRWEQWSMPKFNPSTLKWFFRHEKADGELIKLYDGYATEADALAAHKRLFINRVMGDKGLRAV